MKKLIYVILFCGLFLVGCSSTMEKIVKERKTLTEALSAYGEPASRMISGDVVIVTWKKQVPAGNDWVQAQLVLTFDKATQRCVAYSCTGCMFW